MDVIQVGGWDGWKSPGGVRYRAPYGANRNRKTHPEKKQKNSTGTGKENSPEKKTQLESRTKSVKEKTAKTDFKKQKYRELRFEDSPR